MATKVRQLLGLIAPRPERRTSSALAGGALLGGGFGVTSLYPQARKLLQACYDSEAVSPHHVLPSSAGCPGASLQEAFSAGAFDDSSLGATGATSAVGQPSFNGCSSQQQHQHQAVATTGTGWTSVPLPFGVVAAVVYPVQPVCFWPAAPPQGVSFMPAGWNAVYLDRPTSDSSVNTRILSAQTASSTAAAEADLVMPRRTGASRRQRRRQQEATLKAHLEKSLASKPKQLDERQLLEETTPGATTTTPSDGDGTSGPHTPGFYESDCESQSNCRYNWPSTPIDTPPGSPRGSYLRKEEADSLCSSALALAMTEEGCRRLQDSIEHLDASQSQVLTEQLQSHVLETATSPFGNHVLQKCISALPNDKVQFILDDVANSAVTLAKNRFGCRVLERLIEHFPEERTQGLLGELLGDTNTVEMLCRHAFANFVIQHILEHGSPVYGRRIVQVLTADPHRFAKHRVASHVMKRALVHAEREDREALARALLADNVAFSDLMHHHCGSFVANEVKRALNDLQ